jgi:chromosome segregation ATPase
LAGVAILGAAIWAGTRGWKSAGQRQVKEAQQEIQKHLTKLLQQVRSHFFDVDLAGSRSSRVDEHFNAIEQTLAKHVAKLATQKLAEAQAEINRLTESANLDDEQRKAKAEEVRCQLAEWDRLGQTIKAIQGQLRDLDRSVAPA